jgi:hypothetical protein
MRGGISNEAEIADRWACKHGDTIEFEIGFSSFFLFCYILTLRDHVTYSALGTNLRDITFIYFKFTSKKGKLNKVSFNFEF